MAGNKEEIEGSLVELTPEIAKRLGFINLQAMGNYQRCRETVTLDKLLVDVCNMGQMIIDLKKHIERLEQRLSHTGVERIG